MTLYIKPHTDSIKGIYEEYTKSHVNDLGIDIFFSKDLIIPAKSISNKVMFDISCEMIADVHREWTNSQGETHRQMTSENIGYLLVPRSSICKTGLRMCNSIGIIDAGFRGELRVYVDNHSNEPFEIKAGTSLFQIISCDGSLVNFKLVESLSGSERGTGGFGSTGHLTYFSLKNKSK